MFETTAAPPGRSTRANFTKRLCEVRQMRQGQTAQLQVPRSIDAAGNWSERWSPTESTARAIWRARPPACAPIRRLRGRHVHARIGTHPIAQCRTRRPAPFRADSGPGWTGEGRRLQRRIDPLIEYPTHLLNARITVGLIDQIEATQLSDAPLERCGGRCG